jgi:hypothetical protein
MSRCTLIRDVKADEISGVIGLTALCIGLGEGVAIYWTPESRLGRTSVQKYPENIVSARRQKCPLRLRWCRH